MNVDVFPAVEAESGVFAALRRIRDAVAAEPGAVVDGGARVRAELSPRRDSDGSVGVGRFYWSVQRVCPESPIGFDARTLHSGRKQNAPSLHTFPDDPVMSWLTGENSALEGFGSGTVVQVLRYIPLRRVTLLLRDAPGLPARVIAKTQSEAGLQRASTVLKEVRRAVSLAGGVPFEVPRPIGVDSRRQLLFLEELPGRPLSRAHDVVGLSEAMTRLGTIHHHLHELDVEGVPERGPQDWLRTAAIAAFRIGALVPSVADLAQAKYDSLRRDVPVTDERGFCQGDFVPSQILCDTSGWSVLDLDDGHLADPYSEVAALFTAVARELSIKDPRRQEEARRTYLEAYLTASGRPLDRNRWRWHLGVARLRFLARRLVKGRALPGEAHVFLAASDESGG